MIGYLIIIWILTVLSRLVHLKQGIITSIFLSPILLTEDILKINGFKIEHIHGYTFIKHNHEPILRKENGEPYLWTKLFGRKVECKYVHEFQHALRLCGLNDMGTNFKIE